MQNNSYLIYFSLDHWHLCMLYVFYFLVIGDLFYQFKISLMRQFAASAINIRDFFPETFLYTFILHLPGELIITISSFAHEVWLNSRFSILLAFLNSVFCLSDAILRNSVLILFLLKTYTTWTCCFTLKMILTNLFCFFFYFYQETMIS